MNLDLSPSELAKEIGRKLAKRRKSIGLTQVVAAEQSGLSLSMLRRAESHGGIPLLQLLRLANTIGCRIQFDESPSRPSESARAQGLNQRYPGLVWSNSNASKETYIRKALLHPRFGQLLKLANDFGLESVKDEWRRLSSEFPSETERVKAEVARILRNMETAVASAHDRSS